MSREPEYSKVQRLGHAFNAFAQRFVPDAFIFALLGTVVVVAAAIVATPTPMIDVVTIWGKGFWDLLPFTMQMTLVVVMGYVLATAPVVERAIVRLAQIPRTGPSAIAFVAVFAMLTSWINWGFSLMFSAMLARHVARRLETVDYRAVAAAAFLGLGSVWAQGLSGSAALQMATPAAMTPAVRAIVARRQTDGSEIAPGGLIPLSETIFLWQSLTAVVIEIIVVAFVVWLAAPRGKLVRNAADLGIPIDADVLQTPSRPPATVGTPSTETRTSLGERLEHSRGLSLAFVALATTYLVTYFFHAKHRLSAIQLDTINLSFLTLGALLHGTPARLMRAVRDATPATWGILLQFPFYAGIAAVIAKTHLNSAIAHFFVSVSTRTSYPALIAAYSALLGIFVPSGGSKWVIEAPYVMQAAHELRVHLGWMVACYDLGEAIANLIQPFWMLPILGLFHLRARDVMGFTFLVFVLLAPLVLLLVTILGMTLQYPR